MKLFLGALLSLGVSVAANAQTPAPVPAADPKTETAAAPAAPAGESPAPVIAEKKKEDGTPELSVIAQTAEAQATITGWKISASFNNDVGLGTFTNGNEATHRSITGGLTIGPSYSFSVMGKKLSASARVALGWEYTQPDAINGRRFDWSDLRFGLSAPAVFREKAFTGIAISPRIGFTVPTTLNSWQAKTITVLSAGADLSRTFGNFDLLYRLSASRGFHAQQMVGTLATSVPFQSTTAKCRGNDTFCDYGGMNTEWSVSNLVSAAWRATDSLAFDASLMIGQNWHYPLPQDEFTPKGVDSNGNPVARGGYVKSDQLQASAGVSYAFTDHLEAGFGIGWSSSPLTFADGAWRLRGPLDYPSSQAVSFSLGISALY